MRKTQFFCFFLTLIFLSQASLARPRFQNLSTEPNASPPFGYQVRLGLAKPIFKNLEHYEALYGGTNIFPEVALGYFYNNPFFSLGLSLKMASYTASGNPTLSTSTIKADEDTSITLSLTSLQFLSEIDVKTFGRYVQLKAWFGLEEMLATETRTEDDDLDTDGDEPDKYSGMNSLLVVGGGVKFLISQFDYASTNSMQKILGFGRIYAVPFFETKINLEPAKASTIFRGNVMPADYSSHVIGVGFSFES